MCFTLKKKANVVSSVAICLGKAKFKNKQLPQIIHFLLYQRDKCSICGKASILNEIIN